MGRCSAQICTENQQISYKTHQYTILVNGSMEAGGLLYPNGTYWLNETAETYIGCPCEFQKCIAHCSSK